MKFRTILADCPWSYRQGGRGAARNHYRTMTTEEIAALPIASIAADDAVLFMWCTNPLLPDAMQVIDGWGFTWKTGCPWLKVTKDGKPRMGGGQWLRACTEYLAIATRGKPAIAKPAPLGVILAQRQQHSQKPEQAHDWAERYPVPRLELFARQPRPHWDCWGDEIDGMTIREKIQCYSGQSQAETV